MGMAKGWGGREGVSSKNKREKGRRTLVFT